jgi:hypothetical protein
MSTTTICPACGAKGVACVPGHVLSSRVTQRAGFPLGSCGECGWCFHTNENSDYTAATGLCERCNRPAVRNRDWCAPEHLPRPRDMGDEEFGFRAGLFVIWATRPASELVSQFAIFADWLCDRGSAEEIAARADWRVYAAKKGDPKHWWQWTVPAGAGWVTTRCEMRQGYPVVLIDDDRAKLTKSMHNGRWFLCWPPGFVRFTAPLNHDPSRWRVTTVAGRTDGASPSRPVDRVWPGGYTQLLMDYSAPRLDAVRGHVANRVEDLGLFEGCE